MEIRNSALLPLFRTFAWIVVCLFAAAGCEYSSVTEVGQSGPTEEVPKSLAGGPVTLMLDGRSCTFIPGASLAKCELLPANSSPLDAAELDGGIAPPPEVQGIAFGGFVVALGASLVISAIMDMLDDDPGWFRLAHRSCLYTARRLGWAAYWIRLVPDDEGNIEEWFCEEGSFD